MTKDKISDERLRQIAADEGNGKAARMMATELLELRSKSLSGETAVAEPDFWAVWSATGSHIGTWSDEADAKAALEDYENRIPKMVGSIKALYTRPSPPSEVSEEMVERAYVAIIRTMNERGPIASLVLARAALSAALSSKER